MTTKEICSQFISMINEVKSRRNEINAEMAKCDQIEQDLLHFLENETYDAVVMSKAAKKLKENRKARRVVKFELQQLQSLDALMAADKKVDKLKKTYAIDNKTKYNYRTDVVKELKHEK